MTHTILQIIPADGWNAVYLQDDGALEADPLLAWALMEEWDDAEEERSRYVIGLGEEDDFVSEANRYGNFIGYAPRNEDLTSEKWRERIKCHLEAKAIQDTVRNELCGDA